MVRNSVLHRFSSTLRWLTVASTIVVAVVAPTAVSAAPGDCSLTSGTGGTYVVASQANLQTLNTDANCLDEALVQTANIALTAAPWTPIAGFVGSYDGDGHAITGLVLAGSDSGLFNVGVDGATFADLDITIANSANAVTRVGALVGSAVGPLTITDVDVTGNVSGSGTDVGGLVGSATGSSLTISASQVNGNVSGTSNTAGLVGFVSNAAVSITSSPVTGNVSGGGNNTGGLVGISAGPSLTITSSPVTGNVSGGSYVGGIVGYNPNGPVTITSSPMTGNVTATGDDSGGIVGMHSSIHPLSITSSSVNGHVSGDDYVGGVIGFVPNSSVVITSSSVVGNVTGSGDDVGGVIGYLGGSNAFALSEHSVTGNVVGQDYVGGFIGFTPNSEVSIENGTVDGNVTGTGVDVGGLVGFTGGATISITTTSVEGNVVGQQYVGGLIGFLPNAAAMIDGNDVVGNVTGIPDVAQIGTGENVGGLVGMKGGSGTMIMSTSRVVGDVSGRQYVGGLAGFVPNAGVSIDGSSVEGNVTGTANGQSDPGSDIGGFVGMISGIVPTTITTSHVFGNVSGTDRVGGMVGFAPNSALTVEESFVRGSVTGTGDDVAGIMGQTFADLIIRSSFVLGSVTGADEIGGLAGWANDDVTLVDSYYQGSVTATGSDKGSLIGKSGVSATTTITETFCTDVLCPNAQKITVGELKSGVFLESRGWDLQNVWCVRSDLNDGFPALRAITIGALDATRCRPINIAIWRVSLDPSGGECRDGSSRFTKPKVSVFVGYRYLPAAGDCTRVGFVFDGWADEAAPTVVVKMPLLVDPVDGKKRYFVAANTNLVAVWKPTELDDLTGTAPGAFVGGPDRRTREGGGVVDGFYIPPNTAFGGWMLAK